MSLKETLEARRDAMIAERQTMIDERKAFGEGKPEEFTEEREARFDELTASIKDLDGKIGTLDERVADLGADEAREARAASVRKTASVKVGNEPNPVYRKADTRGPSYFRDLADSTRGDQAAIRRLSESQERAVTTAAGSAGEFAPPLWLVDEFIELARAGRVTADLMNKQPLPAGVSSVNLPRISTGTAVGITQTQATTITNVNMTSTSVSSNITTISGGQTVSIEMLRQSGVPIDAIVLGDLAAAYASQLDVQVLSGSGANGQLAGLVTSGTTVAYTTTTPVVISTTAAASFYNKVIAAQAAVATGRFLPADAIVMTPQRWGWVLEALDGQGRLQVTPNGPVVNAPAVGGIVQEGSVGTLAGLPVYTDPNIPQNVGAATNQDYVFVLRRNDHVLYESAVESASFDATFAASNAVYLRVLGFAAFLTRHAKSAQVIGGTGLVAPTL